MQGRQHVGGGGSGLGGHAPLNQPAPPPPPSPNFFAMQKEKMETKEKAERIS